MKIIILLLSICAGITVSVVSISSQANTSTQLVLHSMEKNSRSHTNKVIANMGDLTCEIYTKHNDINTLAEKDISHMHCHNKQQLDERKTLIKKRLQEKNDAKQRIARKARIAKRHSESS